VKAAGYAICGAAGLCSLGFVYALQPASALAALLLAAWLLTPYVLMGLVVRLGRSPRASLASTAAIAAGGLAFLLVVVWLRPDAQGAIAVMATPLYQLIAAGIVIPVMAHFIRG
jgi:hypothetical protein